MNEERFGVLGGGGVGGGQNFYRQTTIEFIRYDVCWFKTWCTGIFLWWTNFYIGIIVWDVKCGTVCMWNIYEINWVQTSTSSFEHCTIEL